MNSVLVTGSTGFVGSALVSRLLTDGRKVIALAHDLPAAHAGPPFDGAVVAWGDVRDTELIYRLLVDYDISTVFHLAAMASVGKCKANPHLAWTVNVGGTVSVLDACRFYHAETDASRLKSVVIASTDKVYGDGPVPYREGQPLQGVGVYSSTKVAADVAARSYADEFGLPVRIVRSCNVFGPGDQDTTRLIPGSIYKMLHGQKATLYGGRDCIREFVYIDDEVDAYLRIAAVLQYPIADQNVYNVPGSGPIRVSELMKALALWCGGEFETEEAGFREIQEQYMDGSRLYTLGWAPAATLPNDLARTIQWWKTGTTDARA